MKPYEKVPDESIKSLQDLMQLLKKSKDFITLEINSNNSSIVISYFRTLIDVNIFHEEILTYIKEKSFDSLQDIQSVLPFENSKITNQMEDIQDSILSGYILIQFDTDKLNGLLINVSKKEKRDITKAEIEYNIVGPQIAFVEDLDVNLNLVRRKLPTPYLQMKELKVGSLSNTTVAIVYIEGIVNDQNLQEIIKRVSQIKTDHVLDSTYLIQLIADNPNSIFPQFLNTERPDRVAAVLAEGKIALFVDGSPYAITLPTTLIDFFSTTEDYTMPWIIASFFRLLRLFAFIFSVLTTPLYVSILTYHYELIPKELLETLIISRSKVPFPPLIEALFLEITIELLREAGARLPTKVGLTVGIVGGIVIGQASVEASLTSNVLIIIVALSALSSFTAPIYRIGNTIRVIRFPFIISAHLLGLLGIVLTSSFLLVRLLRTESLSRPYLFPFYPTRPTDWKDSIIRMPISAMFRRPIFSRSKQRFRFNPEEVEKNKIVSRNDFDD
ncbi:spore germination protein [Bacillus toyonensis]|uniref:Spore germination protein n=1 Tax=Bacillus toyonensis TaxID=155322 RepID=A0AB73QZY8_9BACI|nr:spore germination protein [Bacillus toyonensis]PEI88229.1 spore germination protein [Bacillus toyonensis]PEK41664.1 spore germination protein [Bacillus toyonensis]PEM44823.1 spore germination protein [Bacillus toyonensis]PGB52873.1 spore germination protein [Bacillus toyonensis]PHE86146.1 spore germination protein [Bacillus toyonensis]